jgi:2-polyprenyl-6-methoxyphenol hydroxylase-like FAD-dependent oxidoreductase
MKAVIIGGGIGGLSAALALERVGIRCDVFEQAAELREVGAGLTVWANAIRALEQLGVAQGVISLGSKVDRFEVRTNTGQILSKLSFANLERTLGVPAFVVVHRADLLRELASGLEKGRTNCGARCVSIENNADEVLARFADGREASADLLVGADGLHSVVRSQLHGPAKPRYAGYACWRGVAHLEVKDPPPGLSFETWGPGARFSVHHCGPGRLFWYGTHNLPEGGVDSPAGRKADVQDVFQTWPPPIPEVIEATPRTEILRNDIVDRIPLANWGRGRVTLLGDAAHPTTPNLGQGACQAIEDAVCLAASLAGRRDVTTALRHYEQARQPRTTAITKDSWLFGSVGQWDNSFGCWLRNRVTQWTPSVISLRLMEKRVSYKPPQLPGPGGTSPGGRHPSGA